MNKKDKELELRILDLDNKEDELNKLIDKNSKEKNKENGNKKQKIINNKTNILNKSNKA